MQTQKYSANQHARETILSWGKVGKKSPNIYMNEIKEKIDSGDLHYSGIDDVGALDDNLTANAVPHNVFELTHEDYENFLQQRRVMMAKKIRDYYITL